MHPYATHAYAQALSHWGRALEVPEWGTCVILRDIDAGGVDAAGPYPFCPLVSFADIPGGLVRLRKAGAVSVTLVLDDFHRPALDDLSPHFALLKPFKTHYLGNRSKPAVAYDTHHKRALKKAQAQVRAGVIDLRKDWQQWQALYDHLIAELHLTGLHAFPAAHHWALSEIEGITAIGAWAGDELVSAHVWASDGTHAHSHLVASNARGYETRAAYAVNNFSLQHFAKEKILNFGGGAGLAETEEDGLARFKRGFANDTAQSYLCGAILDDKRYADLSRGKATVFFPAYRAL